MKQDVKYFLKSSPSDDYCTGYFLNGDYYETSKETKVGHLEGSDFYYRGVLSGSLKGLELTRLKSPTIFLLQEEKM
jgi:hypothetical protein